MEGKRTMIAQVQEDRENEWRQNGQAAEYLLRRQGQLESILQPGALEKDVR